MAQVSKSKKGCDMKIRVNGIIHLALILLTASAPANVFAVWYPRALYHRQDVHEAFKKGEIVYMFHSGTAEVMRIIRVGDNLMVYRVSSSCEAKTVGKIKVLSYVGGTYLKGEVTEGKIRRDDIVEKGNVSCLVISAGMCEAEQ
jgi:hypothetical protein